MSVEFPQDWDTVYRVELTGKTLEAMRTLARWVLDEANAGRLSTLPLVGKPGQRQNLIPMSIIGACDHLFCFQQDTRVAGPDASVTAHE